MANQVIVKNLNNGGIADSDYLGGEGSVAEAVGLDIHSEAGLIKLNQKLTKESGAVVDEFCRAGVACSDGSTYFFGESGGIFKRASNGTYTDEGTVAPAAGSTKVLSAYEYQGYIYYAMQSRLGRWQVGTAWSGRADSWATFSNTDADFHPVKEVSLVLYFGDGNYVAQVDAGVFSANALDIKSPFRISALGKIDTDLLVGTYVSANVMKTEIIRWNTWSVSFSVSDEIPEVGVNAFLDTDNFVVVNAGTKGNLYIYDGAQLDTFKKIKGNWTSTNKAKVNCNAVLNFNGMPLFALSIVTGTGVNLGIYSMARTNRNYPYVLNLEYKISTGNLTNVEFGAIVSLSADQFLVTWKDTTTGTVVGVDILDLTAKQSGHFVTRNIMTEREVESEYGFVHVPYRSMPASTAVNIYTSVNHAAFAAEATSADDTVRKVQVTEAHMGSAGVVKVKVEMVPDGNNAPEVEMAIIDIDPEQ